MMPWSRWFWQCLWRLRPLLAIAVGLGTGLLLTAIAGEEPLVVLQILIRSAVGSAEDLRMTILYSTPLIFTGLAVAIPYRAGLFNIGGEGQLGIGALVATAVALALPDLSPAVAIPSILLSACAAGALWGAIPGFLKATRGGHEVINTIMLNFVATGAISWAILVPLRDLDSQNPQSRPFADAFRLAFDLPGGLNVGLVLGVLVALCAWLFFERSVPGFRIRAVGENESAARAGGIRPGMQKFLAMTLAGGVAGLAGLGDVFGAAGKFRLGFSDDYGFTGIAVAMLARAHPLGVICAAFMFGALQKGAMDLDFQTEYVTKDLAIVLQALVTFAVCADGAWDYVYKKRAESDHG